ncbi:MAG: hypothetical protein OXI87_02395 [Albidovulum sp.]|nr:hypothetical protein [Albidovulum sp.]
MLQPDLYHIQSGVDLSFAFRAAAPPGFPDATKLRAVDVAQDRERLIILALHHRPHNLALHASSGIAGGAGQLYRRNLLFYYVTRRISWNRVANGSLVYSN